jgi:hypothetical protein
MLTNFPNGITSFGVPVLGTIGGLPFTGNYYFVDPVNGADGNEGTPELPLKTLYGALAKCTAGNNDVVVLMGDGSSAGSARLSTALAQTIDSSATAGTLNWNKNATHLIGVAAPTMVAQRARIAPPTGTYTQATFNSLAFINVTASGCYFANLSVFCGFSTGANGMIAWTDSGSRNAYSNVNIFGMADATSAAGANSRSLKLNGGGEHTFTNCVLGGDTVARGAANATVELAGGTARNIFIDCVFPFQASAATPIGLSVATASGMDRYAMFKNCSFINNVGSTSTTLSAFGTMAASAGGQVVFQNTMMVGITEFGSDATTRGQMYIDMPTPTAADGGIGVNPT